ncbi:MAG: universal stress protein [Actinobacteria bacterium]|nr:universal stress protein [Actinomycetota bacterium]
MYMRMLVLLDGSEPAEVVFKYARELSGRLHVDLELLHVCSPQDAGTLPMRKAYIEQKAEQLRAEAGEMSLGFGVGAMGESIQARGSVVVGDPADEILKYIDENDIDLVMMSTHGSSGVKAWDLGEVANKVVHAVKVPIWLVPSELREEIIMDKLPQRSLLIPLSGSKASEAVISHAIDIVQRRGPQAELVVLLHVVDTANVAGGEINPAEVEAERARMQEYLDSVAQRVKEAGFMTRTEVLVGDPGRVIIQFTRDNPPQLLALATSGQEGPGGTVFDSVSEHLMHRVKKTPLMLVRADV